MTQSNPFPTRHLEAAPLLKWALIGALVGLFLISLFLTGANNPNPAWGKFWMIKPLVMVPSAGAAGGVFFYLVNPAHFESTWKKLFAYAACLIVFVIGLWIGTVLGLNGTYWN